MATASASPSVRKIKMKKLEKVKKLGSGAFGAVYQMTWKRKEGSLQVAAKHLSDPDMHELNILSGLDHPSIVKLFGYVDEGVTFMLVLELCEGGSLRDYLDQHGGLSANLDLFLDWAEQATIPIKYLRGKQIVHKDVKSPNYLITCGKTLKLADFGLAKNIAHTISNATERASYPWMAPELLTQGKLSPNYDIFAIAIVIWELWTGQFPFKGLEFQVIAWRVCQLKERPFIPTDMPTPIADLLKRCWDEDWHKRPGIEHIISVITVARTPIWQQQILAGPWLLEKRINEEYVQDIAINPNGDIAVISGLYGEKKVKVYSMEGVCRGVCKGSMDTTKRQPQGQQSDLRQIATSNDGSTYFVTNKTKYVQMFSADCKYKGQWESSCPQVSKRTPSLYGLAVDANDNVYVGDGRSKCINKHTQDGSYITSIKVSILPWYLAATSQDTIIVGCEYGQPPEIVSNTGEVLHTLKHPTDGLQCRCYGVHCYRDMIFITNFKSSSQWEILCYSVSGKYLGHLPIHNVNLRCLAMIGDDKVVVGDWFGHCDIYALQKLSQWQDVSTLID